MHPDQTPAPAMSGAELIAEERQRQISQEAYDTLHDDEHIGGELVLAAQCYAEAATRQILNVHLSVVAPEHWPWDQEWWKPATNPIRNLEKAGALIAAEIDRLQRKP